MGFFLFFSFPFFRGTLYITARTTIKISQFCFEVLQKHDTLKKRIVYLSK